jgi:hypothetical protein
VQFQKCRADPTLVPVLDAAHADFLRTMFKRVDWKAFVEGAQAVSNAVEIAGAGSLHCWQLVLPHSHLQGWCNTHC